MMRRGTRCSVTAEGSARRHAPNEQVTINSSARLFPDLTSKPPSPYLRLAFSPKTETFAPPNPKAPPSSGAFTRTLIRLGQTFGAAHCASLLHAIAIRAMAAAVAAATAPLEVKARREDHHGAFPVVVLAFDQFKSFAQSPMRSIQLAPQGQPIAAKRQVRIKHLRSWRTSSWRNRLQQNAEFTFRPLFRLRSRRSSRSDETARPKAPIAQKLNAAPARAVAPGVRKPLS